MLALLRVGAELQQGWSQHPDAEARKGNATAERAHLLREHGRFVGAQAAAAVFTRPRRHRPAASRHAFEPDALRVGCKSPVAPTPAVILFGKDGTAHLGRAVRFEPGARVLAEGFEVGGRSHEVL